jgi:hypothetical protein
VDCKAAITANPVNAAWPDIAVELTVAHEIGHRLTLSHYCSTRPAVPPLSQALAGALPVGNYAPDTGNTQFYVWGQATPSITIPGRTVALDRPRGDSGDIANLQLSLSGVLPPVAASMIFRYDVQVPGAVPVVAAALPVPADRIYMEVQKLKIMDWGESITAAIATEAFWSFIAYDLSHLSLQSASVAQPPATVCVQ